MAIARTLVITKCQHRNERSAPIFADIVAKKFRDLGYNVIVEENPEKRTFAEFVLAAHQKGRRISKKEADVFLNDFEYNVLNNHAYGGNHIFMFHNFGINANEFVGEAEVKEELKAMESTYDHFRHGRFRHNRLARRIKVFPYQRENGFCRTLIEIPIRLVSLLPGDVRDVVNQALTRGAYERFGGYLLDTDLAATEKAGLLTPKIADFIVEGIRREI